MADRTFQTCTNCGQDLSIALTHLFWRSDCPQDFEYNCKACGAVLSIEVEPLPQFWVELKQRPTQLAPDAGDSAVSTSIVNASAESTSQAESTPTQRG